MKILVFAQIIYKLKTKYSEIILTLVNFIIIIHTYKNKTYHYHKHLQQKTHRITNIEKDDIQCIEYAREVCFKT